MEIKEISIENDFYPKNLRLITNPPERLYVLGNEKILNEESLSIIGSRNSSKYGQEIARKFAREIAKRGITIVSGMARGIDSEAHLGAIEGNGKTIAVLGSGFNYIFPDKRVFNKILSHGGTVITEYEPDVAVFPQGFRDRNRIVAGLSIGTLVIEAKEHSGTGITAEYAKKFDKKIFCIPHEIGDRHGIGTNRLLKRGAILVTEIDDILKHCDNAEVLNDEKENEIDIEIEIPEKYQKVYEGVKEDAITREELSRKINMNISELNTILTMLELEGYIESIPGNYFRRKV